MERNPIQEDNAAGWEIVAKTKYRSELEHSLGQLKKGRLPFPECEMVHLKPLCQECHQAVHLCCSNGQAALSLLNLGVQTVVGIDISQEMIAQATELSHALDAPASWHCCDVLRAPAALNNTMDLVYTGAGAMNWVSDIEVWASVIWRLLRPGGSLFLFEFHPLNYVWDYESTRYDLAPGPDYCEGGTIINRGYPATRVKKHGPPETRPDIHERMWPLGKVINALIQNGLTICRFEEVADPGWTPFDKMEPHVLKRLPHGYLLIAEKPSK